jgi:polyisoprenoid-binding protein YceI
MAKHLTATAIMLCVLAVLPLAVRAQKPDEPSKPETFRVDPVHACVWFRINHLNIANFYGRFNEIGGTFILDKNDSKACSLDMEVKTASIDTNNADRDKHLKAPDYFDAEKHPTITYKSRRFKKVSDTRYEVLGDLTLRGVTKPLIIRLEHTGSGQDPWGNYRAGIETTFTIKRSDFGMTAMPGALGDEVRLTVALEGIRQ